MFYKVKGNAHNVCNDPPVPALGFLFGHQPHPGKCRSACQCICPWDNTIKKEFFEVSEGKEYHEINDRKERNVLHPFFFRGTCNFQHRPVLYICPAPHVPTHNIHYSIVKIDCSFPDEVTFKTQVNVDDGIDQASRINEDIFTTAIPHTEYSHKYGEVFVPAGSCQVC